MPFPLKTLDPDEERKNKEFAVVDIETMSWTKFLVGGFYDGKKFYLAYSLRELLRICAENGLKRDIFAHFGGGYDFLFFLGEALRDYEAEFQIVKIIPRGSLLLSIELEHVPSGTKLTFRDSSALFPFSLERLTENFGVAHKKQKFEHDKVTSLEVYKAMGGLEYLEYDCKGLYECLDVFYNWPIIKRAGGSFTRSSQALRVLQTYLKKPVSYLAPNQDREIRRAYFGGRVEIFRPICKKKIYCYDVNSLYPTVMEANTFPNEFEYDTPYWEPSKHGFYEAEVFVPKNLYLPPLGYLDPKEHKLTFPTGHLKGIWSIPELKYAKELGCTVKPTFGWIFGSAGYLFRDFIRDLHEIKRKAAPDSVDRFLAKDIMNHCYGRFGMKLERETVVIDDGSCGLTPLKEIRVGNRTYRFCSKPLNLKSFTNVAIAAYVTAYARIYVHRLMTSIQDELYYTDTDSLWTTRELPTSDELGALKLECTQPNAVFLLPKTYVAGGLVKMKGFDKRKIKHFTFDDFIAAFEGDLKRLSIINEPKFATFKTALRNGALVGMTKASSRQIRSRYDKRTLVKTPDGWDSIPLHIENESQKCKLNKTGKRKISRSSNSNKAELRARSIRSKGSTSNVGKPANRRRRTTKGNSKPGTR